MYLIEDDAAMIAKNTTDFPFILAIAFPEFS